MSEILEKDYLSLTQVMEILRVSRMMVSKLIAKGNFPNAFQMTHSKNSHYRIPRSDVEAFIIRNKNYPKPQ